MGFENEFSPLSRHWQFGGELWTSLQERAENILTLLDGSLRSGIMLSEN
jgi:hypothetical protein